MPSHDIGRTDQRRLDCRSGRTTNELPSLLEKHATTPGLKSCDEICFFFSLRRRYGAPLLAVSFEMDGSFSSPSLSFLINHRQTIHNCLVPWWFACLPSVFIISWRVCWSSLAFWWLLLDPASCRLVACEPANQLMRTKPNRDTDSLLYGSS
jgi:hypothetical protein